MIQSCPDPAATQTGSGICRIRRVLGEDHPDTLDSDRNLAVDLRQAGRDEEALALDKDTYDRRHKLLRD